MSDLIHKILYTGIGLAVLTEQKAREIVAELEKRGDISSEEGKTLAQELVEKARHHGDELRRNISDEVGKLADKFKWVGRKEYDDLCRRVEQLEQGGKAADSQDSL